MDLSIIMPAYNERETILEAIRRALDADVGTDSWELIVIDDGSIDGTAELLAEVTLADQVTVIHQQRNRGKGHAVRAAAQHAQGAHVAVLDADFEYDPNDFAKMLPVLLDGKVDAVLSTRQWQAHSAFSYWYVIGNRIINTVANILFNSWISDFGSCLKIVRTDLFLSLKLRETGFTFDAELVSRLLKGKHKIYEVPVHYISRTRAEGKKITAVDGIRILLTFIRCRIR